jgi:hypothetical protein
MDTEAVQGRSGVLASVDHIEAARVAVEHLEIVARVDLDAVDGNVTEDFLNHRSAEEPPEARELGPAGLKATIAWLQRAFTDMRFECDEVIVDGDRVAVYATFHGLQHSPFVVHDSSAGDRRVPLDRAGLRGAPHPPLPDPGRQSGRARRSSRRRGDGEAAAVGSAGTVVFARRLDDAAGSRRLSRRARTREALRARGLPAHEQRAHSRLVRPSH